MPSVHASVTSLAGAEYYIFDVDVVSETMSGELSAFRENRSLISTPDTELTLLPAIQAPESGSAGTLIPHYLAARTCEQRRFTFHARALAGGFTPGTSLGAWLSAESLLFLSTTKPAPKA